MKRKDGRHSRGSQHRNRPSRSFLTVLTRREVLSGSAGLALAGAARADDDTPTFTPRGKAIEVGLGHAPVWRIDPASFDPGAVVTRPTYDRNRNCFNDLKLAGGFIPGTSLSLDFYADFQRGAEGWEIVIRFPLFSSRFIHLPLADWLAGHASFKCLTDAMINGRLGARSAASDVNISIKAGASCEVTRDFAVSIVPASPAELKLAQSVVPVRRISSALLQTRSAELIDAVRTTYGALPASGPTSLWKCTGSVGSRLALGAVQVSGNDSRSLSLFGTPDAITFEGFAANNKLDGLVHVSLSQQGEPALNIKGAGSPKNGVDIFFDSFDLTGLARTFGSKVDGTGRLAGTPTHIVPGGAPPSLEDAADTEVSLRGFEAGSLAVIVGARYDSADPDFRYTFSAQARAPLVVLGSLYRAHVPVSGTSGAEVSFPATPIRIVFGNSLPAPAASCECQMVVGSTSTLDAPLESSRLWLRRSADLFDLQFGFRHYALSVKGGKSNLIRRAASTGCSPNAALPVTPHRIVHFRPQHVFEEVVQSPVPLTAIAPTRTPAGLQPPTKMADARLTRTQLSGPTRLVFRDAALDQAPRPVPLTIEYLTDWADLAMQVNKRARSPRVMVPNAQGVLTEEDSYGDTVDDHVNALGIASDSTDVARTKIFQTVAALDSEETAIELPTRLILSPNQLARWRTRPPPQAGQPAEIWSAELDQRDVGSSVRAIWARDLDMTWLGASTSNNFTDIGFPGPMTQRDRSELVGLSSIYGQAGLRRVIVNGNNSSDDSTGSVVLPQKSYNYLAQQTDTNNIQQVGIIVPKTFDSAFLSLTSRGASFELKWQGEPPAKGPDGGPGAGSFLRDSYTVEKFINRASYGRDVYVELDYKGFLLPHGNRSSFIKVSEREVFPWINNSESIDPTSYFVQRYFIIVRKPKKEFPALNQPFASRDFPANTIELLTRETPDLDTPSNALADTDPNAPMVFWPTLLGTKSTTLQDGIPAIFQFTVDGQPGVRQAPLLFVGNDAVHNPDYLGKIVDYYRRRPADDPLRTAQFNGLQHTYAEPRAQGETTFQTHSWTLSVRGRFKQVESTWREDFDMDAVMEGADQPPFYPVVQTANVTVQPLERLLGRGHGTVNVGFNQTYVQSGFDAARNPSELYLDVQQQGIYLDASSNGNAVGGVAKPNAQLAALSRKIGFVGGRPASSPPVVSPLVAPPAPVPGGNNAAPAFDLQSALAGRFDPVEFLGGALKDAKLLGVVPLKEVLRAALMAAAPQLRESPGYAMADSNAQKIVHQMRTALQTIAVNLVAPLQQIQDQANATLNEVLQQAGVPPANPPLTVAALYPDLISSLRALQSLMKDIGQNAGAASASAVFAYAAETATSVRALLTAIEAVALNPVPPLIGRWISTIQDYRNKIAAAFMQQDPLAVMRSLVLDQALQHFTATIADGKIFEAFFGQAGLANLPYKWSIFPLLDASPACTKEMAQQLFGRLVSDPGRDLPRLNGALFFEVFSEPFMSAIGAGYAVADSVSNILPWSRQAIANGFVSVVRQYANVLRQAALQQHQQISWSPSDLRHENLELMAWQVVTQVEALIAQSALGGDPATSISNRLTANQAAFTALVKDIGNPSWLATIDSAKQAVTAQAAAIAASDPRGAESIRAQLAQLDDTRAAFKAVADSITAKGAKAFSDYLLVALKVVLRDEFGKAVKVLQADATKRLTEGSQFFAEKAMGVAGAWFSTTAHLLRFADTFAITQAIPNWFTSIPPRADGSGGDVAVLVQVARQYLSVLSDDISISTFTNAVDEFARQLDLLVAPANIASDIRSRLKETEAALRRSIQLVAEAFDGMERIRLTASRARAFKVDATDVWWKDTVGDLRDTNNVAKFLQPVGAFFELRQKGSTALHDVLADCVILRDALATFNGPASQGGQPAVQGAAETAGAIRDASNALKAVVDAAIPLLTASTAIVQVASKAPEWTRFTDLIKPITNQAQSAAGKNVKALADRMPAQAQVIVDKLAALHGQDSLAQASDYATLAHQIGAYAMKHERRMLATLMQSAALPGSAVAIRDELARWTATAITSLVDPLLLLHDPVNNALTEIVTFIQNAANDSFGQLLAELFGNTIAATMARFSTAAQAVQSDTQALNDLKTAASAATPNIVDLVDKAELLSARWSHGEPGLVLGFRAFTDLVNTLLKGHLPIVFDFGALKSELQQALEGLIPAQIELNYDWDTELTQFPSSDPIFTIDRTSDGGLVNDLVLKTKIEVDVLTGARKVSGGGHLRPFQLRLLGSDLDLVTISFAGAHFTVSPGSDAHFQADISGAETGPLLQFLEPIEDLMSPSSDDGLYKAVSFAPPEVTVGYRYSAPVLSVGELAFINIAFDVGATLPFDDRQAEFRFLFASRNKPFLISAAPYGGGGFVGLYGNASGITAFEIQLEFGAVIAIDFGPLSAQGRVTAGIYLMSRQGGARILEGFVHAVGEGNIACFSLTVDIEVSTRQTESGAMEGSSSFSISFSVSFFEVSYSFTAHYATQGGGGSGNSGSPPQQVGAQIMMANQPVLAAPIKLRVQNLVPPKETKWSEYRQYLDL